MIDGILIWLALASGRKLGKALKYSIGFNVLNICWSFCSSYICSLADFSAIGILNALSLLSPAVVIGHCFWELEAHSDDWARRINTILSDVQYVILKTHYAFSQLGEEILECIICWMQCIYFSVQILKLAIIHVDSKVMLTCILYWQKNTTVTLARKKISLPPACVIIFNHQIG